MALSMRGDISVRWCRVVQSSASEQNQGCAETDGL
jgi:hypothetical protein